MSIDRFARMEDSLPGLFDDLADARTPDYLDAAIERASARPQRPSWTFPERWLPMELVSTRVPTTRMPWRQLGVLALIALLLGALLAVYIGSQTPRLPAPFGPAANGDVVTSVDGDIVRLNPSTGASKPIVSGPAFDSWAKVSPDGQHVAFTRTASSDDHDTDIVVAGIDGSDPHVLTTEPVSGGLDMLAWAPDSRWLLVDTSLKPDIWRYDASGATPPTKVVSSADAYASPFRPPNGSAILIYRNLGRPRLLSFDLATSTETVLADGRSDQDFDDVRWSPDGSMIVYHAAPADDPESQRLFVMNADGSGEPRQLTNAPGVWWDIDETWSPDGRTIAFDRYEHVGTDWIVRSLAIVDVALGTVREVGPIAHDARAKLELPTDSQASPGEGMWFEWSPDGRYLLAVPTEAPAHPVIIEVASGGWRNLDPVVLPDFVDQAWQRLGS